MDPVVNLSATYIPESNTVLVTWWDMDSLMMEDSNYTYEVVYDITVAGIVLLGSTSSGELDDSPAGNFSFSISEGDFFQPGVSVNVTVVATDMLDIFNVTTTAEIDGGKGSNY